MAISDAAKLVIVGTQLACQVGEPYLAWTYVMADGRRVDVRRMLFDNARLCVGPADIPVYDAGYCYAGVTRAILAAVEWIDAGGVGEPDGWKKNLQSQEYRPENDEGNPLDR